MYGCESWTIKKAECQRTDAFELWCWTRLLRVPWTSRTSNQSILKEIRPGCPLEGLMLSWNSNTLATWWEELTHLKRPWCWERLRTGGEGDDREWDGWWHHQQNGHGFGWIPGVGDGWEAWHAVVHAVTMSRTQLRNWTGTEPLCLECTNIKELQAVSSTFSVFSRCSPSCPFLILMP